MSALSSNAFALVLVAILAFLPWIHARLGARFDLERARWIVAAAALWKFARAAMRGPLAWFVDPTGAGWDFRVYYFAARALRAGLDPYDHQALARVANTREILGCNYPPLVVAAYVPLQSWSLPTALLVYDVAKLAALVALLVLWARRTSRAPEVLVAAGALWAYAIRMDFASGNVSVFEQLALWSGLAAAARGRDALAGGTIGLASFAKLTPLSYAPVALLTAPRRGWITVGVASAVAATFLALNALIWPDLTASWFRIAAGMAGEQSYFYSPALYGLDAPRALLVAAFVAVAVLSAVALRSARDPEGRVLYGILAITALLPRLKDYGFIVLIPPIGYLLARCSRARLPLAVPAITAAVVVLTAQPARDANVWADHRPTVLLFALWGLWTAGLLAGLPRRLNR